MRYRELMTDPRPGLLDSKLWTKLFRQIPTLPDLHKAEVLQRRLWTVRSIGATIQHTHISAKIVPLIEPAGGWESQEYFDQVKEIYLGPFTAEIRSLLNRL